MNYTAESIFELVKLDIENGVHSYTCTKNNITLNFEMVNYYESTVFSSNIFIGNTTPDNQMLILKFHKNLTIESGVTITPQVRKKGFTIFCMGVLTNNGTITMTGKGAAATGEDVYLYKDDYVPKAGATGGSAFDLYQNAKSFLNGNKGNNGTNRQSGGGGTGGARAFATYNRASVGKGGNGTSYSGGVGSGGTITGPSGSGGSGNSPDNGGTGSDGKTTEKLSGDAIVCALGGTGNPSGQYGTNPSKNYPVTVTKREGTGGLLILFALTLKNEGVISSNGISSSTATIQTSYNYYVVPGGASGGGSINIFYENLIKQGTVSSNGGSVLGIDVYGGAGGNGSITSMAIDFKLHSKKIYQIIKQVIFNNELIKKYLVLFEEE